MSETGNLALMADYNRWMNEQLYALAAPLGEAALREDRGAFFGSLFGTFSHILVADIIWLKRFAGSRVVVPGFKARGSALAESTGRDALCGFCGPAQAAGLAGCLDRRLGGNTDGNRPGYGAGL